jgi:hypothetical protein
MSFSDFKSLPKVAEKYKITTIKSDFTTSIEELQLNQGFVEDIYKAMKMRKTNSNEYFLCEFLISPVLFQILKLHSKLNLWSHDCTIDAGEEGLNGVPDYLISYKGETEDYEQLMYPILTVADAKKDDFAGGWAQTLAEMIALQKLNKDDSLVVYGIVTNGTLWEFGMLRKNIFVQNTISYSLGSNLNKIAGILNHIYTDITLNIEKFLSDNNIELKTTTMW